MKQRGRRWKAADDEVLRKWWGHRDLLFIAYWLKRTEHGVVERARKLKLRRPTLTLRAFARLAGVTTKRVYWALEMRGMQLERVHRAHMHRKKERGSHYAITPEQQDILLSVLRAHPRANLGRGRGRREYSMEKDTGKSVRGVWGCGRKPDACRECSRSDVPHFAKGFCKACYTRVWRWKDRGNKNPALRRRGGYERAPRSLFI